MKKKISIICVLAALMVLVSCATTRYFAGTVGGIYITTDDYSVEKATTTVNNNTYDLEDALWPIEGGSKMHTNGKKILFYCDLDAHGFFNEYVPDQYRATSIEDAGFLIVAEEDAPVFYQTYYYQNGGQCKVNYGTGFISLYSLETGKCLYTGSTVHGPQPPESMNVYAGTTSVTWDTPNPSDFKSQIASVCNKLASGKIVGSIVDEEAMAAMGLSVKETNSSSKNTGLKGVWCAIDDTETVNLTITDNVFAVEYFYDNELYAIDLYDCAVNDDILIIDGDICNYEITGKTMTCDILPDYLEFKKVSDKAENSTNPRALYGVWESDIKFGSILAAFTKDGFMIFQSADSHDMDTYSTDGSTIEYDSHYPDDYYIVNDTLYIVNSDIFPDYYNIIKFNRITKGGEDQTSLKVLTGADEWDYTVPNLESGTRYSFKDNGNFSAVQYNNGTDGKMYSGKYTMDEHIISLSNGTELSFAYIDGYPIGFTL